MPRKDTKAKVQQSEDEHEHEGTPEYSTDEYPDGSPDHSGSNKKKSGRNIRKRPAKRTLVRWNETLDQRTLLAVQHECNINGVKIPWAQVGARLGPTITEGAIVQHLAKLRTKLEKDGVPVTPALKRGGGGSKTANNTKTVSAKGAVAKRTGNSKSKTSEKKKAEVEDSDKEGEYYDSEEEPIMKKRNRLQSKKGKTAVKGTSSPRVKTERDVDTEGMQSEKQTNKSNPNLDAEGDTDNMESYEHDSETGDTQAVAVGAPFLAQQLTDKSSVSSNNNSMPSKMVVLQVGHNNAQAIQGWAEEVESGGSRVISQGTSHASPLDRYSNQPISYPHQGGNAFVGADMAFVNNDNAFFGQYDTNIAYGGNNNFNFDQQGSFDVATPRAPSVKHASRGGSISAGYGTPSGHYNSEIQAGDFDKTMMGDMASQCGVAHFQHSNHGQIHNYGRSNLGNDAGSFGLGSDFPEYGLPQPETPFSQNPFGAQGTNFAYQSGYVNSPKRQKVSANRSAGKYRNNGNNFASANRSYGSQGPVPRVPIAQNAASRIRDAHKTRDAMAATKIEQPDASCNLAAAASSALFNESFSPAFDFQNGDNPNDQLGNQQWYNEDPILGMGSNDFGDWGDLPPFDANFGFD